MKGFILGVRYNRDYGPEHLFKRRRFRLRGDELAVQYKGQRVRLDDADGFRKHAGSRDHCVVLFTNHDGDWRVDRASVQGENFTVLFFDSRMLLVAFEPNSRIRFETRMGMAYQAIFSADARHLILDPDRCPFVCRVKKNKAGLRLRR